jgi:hypothetical protein
MILNQLLSRCSVGLLAGTVLIIGLAQPAIAVSYVAIDLGPAGFGDSQALGISGHEQVGVGFSDSGGTHALLWTGTAASVVDLHPSGFVNSLAEGVSHGRQVGVGSDQDGHAHALLWAGSAAGVVDLHPIGFSSSEATGIWSHQQVGFGDINFHDHA